MRDIGLALILVLASSAAFAGEYLGTPNAKETVWIEKQKDLLEGRLKDPGSAHYRNLRVEYFEGKTPVVCGQVNAKNSFGGYMGYQRWIGADIVGVFLQRDVTDFDNLWSQLCR